MASIVRLPVEILHGICHRLALLSTESLRNLCLANKDLNRICSPCLVYRWSDGQDCAEPPLERFLLHLFKYPKLRKKVKSLATSYTDPPAHEWGLALRPLPVDSESETLSKLAQAAASDIKMKPEYLEELCSDIELGSREALIVLLLAWCTNVADLSISIPPLIAIDGEDSHILTFTTEAARLLSSETPAHDLPFGELRHFELHYVEHHRLYFEAITPFFHLPKIKSLMASNLDDSHSEEYNWHPEDDRYIMQIPDASSSLEELEIINGRFVMDGLSLLRGVRNLKKLTIQTIMHYGENHVDRLWFCEGLQDCEDSVEELYLDTEPPGHLLVPDSLRQHYGKESIINHEILATSCLFKDFVKLRRLRCPMTDILVVDLDNEQYIVRGKLPKSIEFVKSQCFDMIETWNSNNPSLWPFIEAFIKILEEAGPGHRLYNLKVLDLSDTFKDDPQTFGINTMKVLADARGVQLLLRED